MSGKLIPKVIPHQCKVTGKNVKLTVAYCEHDLRGNPPQKKHRGMQNCDHASECEVSSDKGWDWHKCPYNAVRF